MQSKHAPRLTASRLSTIAFAPIPPPGHAYLFRSDAPRSALRSVKQSPYGPLLTAYFYPDGPGGSGAGGAEQNGTERTGTGERGQRGTIYVAPISNPDVDPAVLPGWYRPDPDPANRPPLVPLPAPPEPTQLKPKNAAYLKAEQDAPTGGWLKLPRPSTNSTYYRSRFSTLPPSRQPEFAFRYGAVYVRFPADPNNPTEPDPRIPADAYQDPPLDGRRTHRDRVRPAGPSGTAQAHAYLYPHIRQGHIPQPYRQRVLRDLSAPAYRYIPVTTAELQAAAADAQTGGRTGLFFMFAIRHVICHEDTPLDTLPTFPDRYEPLRVYRQDPPQPRPEPGQSAGETGA